MEADGGVAPSLHASSSSTPVTVALLAAPRLLALSEGEPAAQRLREAGIGVIQDRCIMVDHRRLLGSSD